MTDILPIRPRDEKVSYDLGWLLQNEQISDERLCNYLLEETRPEIERLAARFLKAPAERMAAVDQIFFTVLQQRRSYKSNISGKVWLYTRVIAECMARTGRTQGTGSDEVLRAVDTRPAKGEHFGPFLNALTERQRFFAHLSYGQDLSAEEIARLLKIGQQTVTADLEQAQQGLIAHQRSCEECATRHSTLKGMETTLRAVLQASPGQPGTTPEMINTQTEALLGRLARAETGRRKRQWAARAFETGLALVAIVSIWAFTRGGLGQPLAAEPSAGPAVQLAAELKQQPAPQTTPTLVPTTTAPADTVPLDNAYEDVLALTRTSWTHWQSLWADVQVKAYTMENYGEGTGSKPGWSQRKQIWLSLPDAAARVINGPLSGSPSLTYTVANQHVSGLDFESGQTIENPTASLIPDADLQRLFSPPDMFTPGGQFVRMPDDAVAGRPAWVLDWWQNKGRRTFRYWIDQEYGIVLRRIQYGGGVFYPIASDIVVTKIFFDASFPAAIYEPYRYKGDHFANDFSGNPELIDLKSALRSWSGPQVAPVSGRPSFVSPIFAKLATSRLTFVNVPAGWRQSAEGPRLELFANQVDLGQVPLGGKSILACQRSPDGSRIAYNSPPQEGTGDTTLLVADLGAVQAARPALAGGITSGDFAFSPDNRRLAFFGCEKASGFCGMMILELASGKLTHLVPLAFADYITWSPDGRSIALVGNDDASGQSAIFSTANIITSEMMNILHTWHFQVVDASSGNVTYKTKFDWFNLGAPADSPTHQWGGQPFKVPAVGVTACADPQG